MTLAEVKIIIDQYLIIDQPPASLAVTELRIWLRDRQTLGDIHAFSVRRAGAVVTVDVQPTLTGPTHTLHFTESIWMSRGRGNTWQTNHSHQNTITNRRPEPPEDAYDRAMRGV